MKKHFLFAALAMTALFSACSNEEENLMTTGNEVNFVIGGVESRATTTYAETGGYITAFEDNDKIGIYSSGLAANTEMNNQLYTVSGSTLVQDGETSYTYVGGETQATFNAYFPYAEDNTSFTVATNQSTADAFYDNDFMTATATESTGTVTLEFSHRMVLVEVNLTGFEEDVTISSVKFNGVKPTIAYTAASATMGEVSGNAQNIAMFPQTANSRYWAIIPAQTFENGVSLTISTTDGDAYSYTTSTSTSFTEGNLVRYNLALAASTQEVVSVGTPTIAKWGANTNDVKEFTDLTLQDATWSLDIQLPTGEIATSNGYYGLTEAGWSYGTKLQSVNYETQNAIFYIKGASDLTSTSDKYWTNHTLFYYAGNEKIKTSKNYILSYKVKRGTATQQTVNNEDKYSGLQVFLCKNGESDTDKVVYKVTDKATVAGGNFSGTADTDGYYQQSVTFVPAYYFNNATSSNNALTFNSTTEETSSIIIGFRPVTIDNADFYIKDITFKEVTE